jgi:Ras-related protein Rab-1A
MFSLEEPGSLQYLTHWVHDTNEFCPDALKFLVANKTDLEATVNLDSMKLFANSHDCMDDIVQISAKTGEGITQLLNAMAKELLPVNENKTSSENNLSSSGVIGVGSTPDPTVKQWKSGCCKSL